MQATVKNQQKPKSQIESFKYSFAAFCSTFCVQILHPFDLIKTRFQSHDGMKGGNNIVPQYKNIRNAFQTIYSQEGVRGLYKGFGWTLFAQSVSRVLFFTLYEKSRDFYEKILQHQSKEFQIFVASTQSGVIATFITTPMWILKTRMLLNTKQNISGYQNLNSAILSIYNEHGILGFWRGLSVSLPLCFHGTIQMSVFEKVMQITRPIAQDDTYNIRPAFAGFFSKLCAILATYPLQTLRTRIQQNQYIHTSDGHLKSPKYKNVRDVVYKLYQKEGILSLYKGVKPSLIMNLPSNSIYFFCYEFFKKALNISRDQKEIKNQKH
ncbi:folate carrier protein, putative (macronuclear) [Tetrahymena thermophila SB210]|uniref:Folate carrier protein, putative n=1 Tax=Tetrahymena thermophila (strain SB210) TaxID=312017 RepID=Q22MF8_TETTS|nr:folate carrier protein, putative [Tetrahymena thermophila SB210]EAR86367.3 folate carrier protein, putative [Tetrahymena thermophila SB210]|eukprot:XP_977062.3 folate carrier protein, putative [Tetrahymena thermophila SB210]